MVDTKHVFQISGIKSPQKKGKLLHGIQKLRGKYIGGSVYREGTTHLIVTRTLPREKFLSACAGGKWIVTPEYVLDSVKNRAWLPEGPYELNVAHRTPGASNPARVWRERVASGALTGAFEGWVVLMMIHNPYRRDLFTRILKAGKAKVYFSPPPLSKVALTHVLVRHVTEHVKLQNAPCYSLNHIAKHLFWNTCVDMGSNWLHEPQEDHSEDGSKKQPQKHPEEPDKHPQEPQQYPEEIPQEPQQYPEEIPQESVSREANDNLLSALEMELRDYVSKVEQGQNSFAELFLEFRSYSVPKTRSQIIGVCNVQTLLECGLFSEALDEILGSLQPGMLPPVPHLQTLMQHALQGEATPYFLCTFRKVLHTMLQCNTPWGIQSTVKYFTQVLQCPECKNGLWPFLQTSVRYCMASESTCHSLHSPASPELLHFHGDLQAFVLKLFQCEIHSAKTREKGGSRPSVLYGSFWSMWERTTLGSRPVLQLTQLVVQASEWELSTCQGERTDRARRQELRMTLQDTLSVVVEYWCQEHSRLNRSLVEKSLEDLAEHIAILCQDLPPDVVRDFVPSIPSTRLQLVTADAIFRNVCCRNGVTVGTEPLSLLKMVSSYLPALGRLCGRRPGGSRDPRADSRGPRPVTEPTSHSWTSQGSGSGMLSVLNNGTGPRKENIPRGLHKVNAAGETLLHRACKKNQVETLLHILALPGTDVNVKDHAGWTPLHEACNHGSSACVEALLLHCPAPHLNSQVGGVSPLHDALLNGHMDIAKMLLQHAGSALLQQRDGQGRTAMDLVTTVTLREELRRSALAGDLALEAQGSEVRDLPFLEVCSCLLAWLLACYLKERGAPILSLQAQDQPLSLGVRLARALEAHPAQKVAEGWGDPRLVSLLEDLETVLGVGRYLAQVGPAVRECQGPRTRFLISLLERLAGAASLAYTL